MTSRTKILTSINPKQGGGYAASISVLSGDYMIEYVEDTFGTIREAQDWLLTEKAKYDL